MSLAELGNETKKPEVLPRECVNSKAFFVHTSPMACPMQAIVKGRVEVTGYW